MQNVWPTPIIACASLQEQSSQDGSRLNDISNRRRTTSLKQKIELKNKIKGVCVCENCRCQSQAELWVDFRVVPLKSDTSVAGVKTRQHCGSTFELYHKNQKFALIRRIGLFLCRGWAQHIVDRWRDAVSPGSSPSVSNDFDLLPCDISPDFLYRGADRGINVPGA